MNNELEKTLSELLQVVLKREDESKVLDALKKVATENEQDTQDLIAILNDYSKQTSIKEMLNKIVFN